MASVKDPHNDAKTEWPRIRDLPEEDREPFNRFLVGQSRPMIDDAVQDAFFSWDYAKWKRIQGRND